MFFTVYKITNQIDGKIYIGTHKTKDLNDNYMGSGKYLIRAQEKYGIENFAEAVSKNGGTGVITPDLTIEEAGEWLSACKKYALDPIFVVAPSTSDIRLKKVTAQCRGFIYAASLMGVTGTRSAISSQAEDLVARIRNVTSIPVSVGLGVSNAEQAKTVSKFADGVIVGSAFIAKVQSAKDFNEALHEVETLARELKAGIC